MRRLLPLAAFALLLLAGGIRALCRPYRQVPGYASSVYWLFGGDRQLVRSTGAVARVNMFGFAVLQVDWVKPLDRPGKQAFFEFNLLTGF